MSGLDAQYAASFREMVSAVRNEADHSAFWPVVGRRYEGASKRVLIVGRATNAWGDHGLDVERARAYSDVGECDEVLTDEKYVRRSAFWCVGRAVLEHLSVGQDVLEKQPNGWMQSLAWSNLFKVAPMKGWNPSVRVRDRIRDTCVDLFGLEVRQLRPHVVLVLTGIDWFEAFQKGLGLELQATDDSYVDGVAQAAGVRWIIAKHPMRKPRAAFLAEVKRALDSRD